MKTGRVYLALVAILLTVFLVVGCGGGTPQTTPPDDKGRTGKQESTASTLPKILNVATNPVGSMFNNIGSGIAAILGKYLPLEAKVTPVSGHSVWLPMVATKEVDMAIINSYDAELAYMGKGEYEKVLGGKGADIVLLTSGAPGMNGCVVAEDSGIRKGKDLKGKRYAGIYANSTGVTAQAQAFLANQGLTEKDVKMITVPGVTQAVQAIMDGRVDAAGSVLVGVGTTAELDASRGARFLSYDPSPEAVKRMQQVYPYGYIIEVHPGPKMVGIKEDPTYLMGWDIYLIGRGTLDDEVAYQIVKTLWEHDVEMGPIHPALKDWTKDKYVTPRASIPYHPGAIKWYKEVGVWSPEMEKLQQDLLAKRK